MKHLAVDRLASRSRIRLLEAVVDPLEQSVLVYRPPALMKSGESNRGWTNPQVSGTVG